MTTAISLLGPGDEAVFENVADDVFDHPIQVDRLREFLTDPRHHIAVAVQGGQVVGFCSAVHYVHPDKTPELWINEVGVAAPHRRQGLASALMRKLLDHGKSLGCAEAWVLTERANRAARSLYGSLGGVETDVAPVMVSFRLSGESEEGEQP